MDSESLVEYDKIMSVVIYVCVWLLSVVILNTFSLKSNTNSEKNYIQNKRTVEKLDSKLTKLNRIVEAYYNAKYDHTGHSLGINTIKKEFYDNLINALDTYESSDTIRFDQTMTPFPIGDVIIYFVLLIIMTSIVVITNFINNPFTKIKMMSRLASLQKQLSNVSTQKGGDALSAPADFSNGSISRIGLNAQQNNIDSRTIFNKMTFSFSILCITVYICIQMMTSSIQKRQNTKDGTLITK
jgi:uncharacterized protein YxeA